MSVGERDRVCGRVRVCGRRVSGRVSGRESVWGSECVG